MHTPRATFRSLVLFAALAAAALPALPASAAPAPALAPAPSGIHKIQHVVIIMQENRSFDSYFGTFPGAAGIPMSGGHPSVCVPDPRSAQCVAPFHDARDINAGGPHGETSAIADIAGGLMNGFIARAEGAKGQPCTNPNNPGCGSPGTTDVMGYHDGGEIPNYWAYAKNFVLQDHMFQPNLSWSLPQHLFMVSGWSAFCKITGDPMSCASALESPANPPDYNNPTGKPPDYAWTDLTYLLHRRQVSWGYYVFAGGEPDCVADESVRCAAVGQSAKTPGIWNPLPYFDTVREDGQLGNIQSLGAFYSAAAAGTLPAVSWIDPNQVVSEHPPARVSAGQAYVTSLINAVMRSPDWSSTAVFVSWDDWGGFYDHVPPTRVDQNGYGLRVPGLLISPYARPGFVDGQTLSHDAYLKFIEDAFLGGERLNPATDGRPDARPNVREASPALGDLTAEFDFNQAPAAPFILPTHPAPWSIPTAFRLMLTGMPLRQAPRHHGGNLVARLTCTVTCQVSVSGSLAIPGARRRHRPVPTTLRPVPTTLATFSGTHYFSIKLPRSTRRLLLRALARHRTALANLSVTATNAAAPGESTSTTLLIRLVR